MEIYRVISFSNQKILNVSSFREFFKSQNSPVLEFHFVIQDWKLVIAEIFVINWEEQLVLVLRLILEGTKDLNELALN